MYLLNISSSPIYVTKNIILPTLKKEKWIIFGLQTDVFVIFVFIFILFILIKTGSTFDITHIN